MEKLPGVAPAPAPGASVASGGSPGPSAGQSRGVGDKPGVKSTPEQRERWRRKAAAAYARKIAQEGRPLPSVGRPNSPSSPGQGGGPAPGGVTQAPHGPTVPWTGDTLKGLFEQLVPAAERFAVDRLTTKAASIDPSLVGEVGKDAAWNPAAKAGLVAAGPQCAAELLNDMGIGADKAHWAALVAAAGSIAASHMMLASRLDKLAREKPKAAESKPA